MAEDGYTSSTAWDSGDQSDVHLGQFHGRPSFQSLDSVDETSSTNGHFSPQPRSSSDSRSKSPNSQQIWRDTAAALATIHRTPSLVEPSFDENVLRALCELDVNLCTFRLDFFLTCFISVGFPYFLIESNRA